MHPALHSWREELPPVFVRALAVVSGIAVLSMAAAEFVQSPPVMETIAPAHRSPWIEVERPHLAFTLTIPEAIDVPSHYAIQRHADGGGRKDILELGDPDGAGPYLQVEIYRPGSERNRFAEPEREIAANAAALAPAALRSDAPLASKFGPLSIVAFETSKGTPRRCLGFVRSYDDPRLQMSGWFCQGGSEFIERGMLSCALDRLSLLSAGSEPKVGALFAQAELNRSFCGQRDPILASTPKYKELWRALPARPEPRRIGR